MHLFDALTSYSKRGGGTHEITMIVRGYAASMAAILLQSVDVRVIGPESYLLVHEISAGAIGKIGEMKDDMKWYERVCERIATIFVQRSGGKVTKAKFKANWTRKDWWLDSDEALRLGFVDKIG
jgi:ATP-dependent protease ClpP protease subunit